MTYRDPNEPLGAESPTEAYRVPEAPSIQPVDTDSARPASTSPAVVATATRRPNRARWAAALAVVALVVVASGVAAALLTGQAPNAKVLGWVPADSVVYGEFRLDLPGDQRQNLGEFLSHFPGFDDQAALDTKLNETLDQFLTSVTEGDQSYTGDIEPWFDGEVAVTLAELPDPDAMRDPESMDAASAAMLLSIKDAALAQAWFDERVQDASPTTEEYEGVTLTLVSPPRGSHDGTMAYAITDDIVVLGEVTGVKDVLDTNGDSAITDDPEFAAALDSGSGDHVGFMYYDMAAYWDWAMQLSSGSEMSSLGIAENLRESVPAWAAVWVRVEGDALSLRAATPPPTQRMGPSENRASTLIEHAPATTIAYGETHDYGKAITDMLATYSDAPVPEETTQQLEQVVGMFGGVEGLVGWIGDVAFVVNDAGASMEGGVLIQPTDATQAQNLFLTVRSMLTLGGASFGVTVSDEQHGEATITTVDFGELGTLLQQAGSASIVPGDLDVFGGADAHVQLSWAVTDDLVVFGIGPEFVRHVLDTDAGSSLAASERFSSLLDRTGEQNTGIWFADIAAIRVAIEEKTAAKAEFLDRYEREVKPFLEPFDAVVGSAVLGGSNADTATFLITVK